MRRFRVVGSGVMSVSGGALLTPVNSASAACASIEMARCTT